MIRLYFYGPPTAKKSLLDAYRIVKQTCARADVSLSTNIDRMIVDLPTETIAAHQATGAPLLDAMHAIIVEGSTQDPQAGYLLAYAIAEKRPLLYLYIRGDVAPDVLRYLNLKDLPKHVTIAAYRSETLDTVVSTFLSKHGDARVREVPRIKFTLRLTDTLDQYLDFKTRNTGKTKADFLRDRLEHDTESDHAFQAYLKKRRG